MICWFHLVGIVWGKAGFIIRVKASFVSYLYLYPKDTDFLREISSKSPKWAFPACQGPEGRTWEPSATLYISQRADSWPSAFILCLPTPESKPLLVLQHQWMSRWRIIPVPLLLVSQLHIPSWKHPLLCVWLLLFAGCVHRVCNRRRVKSSLLFSSWIICWLALKIYLDTGDSITGKTSKDLPKYNRVHV